MVAVEQVFFFRVVTHPVAREKTSDMVSLPSVVLPLGGSTNT